MNNNSISSIVLIQSWWRGVAARFKIILKFLCGEIIGRKWCQHKRYRKFKSQIRQKACPVLITLHNIRGISPIVLEVASINVVVNVWWNWDNYKGNFYDFRSANPPTIKRPSSHYRGSLVPAQPPKFSRVPDYLLREFYNAPFDSSLACSRLTLRERIMKYLPSDISVSKLQLLNQLISVPCRKTTICAVLLNNRTPQPQQKNSTKNIFQHPSLIFDDIGRNSVNLIGKNLLSPRNRPLPDRSQPVISMKPTPQRDMFTFSRTRAVHPIVLPSRYRSVQTESLLGEENNYSDVEYEVSLGDEEFYLPGCPGNSMLKFDIYEGNIQLGTGSFDLSCEKSLFLKGGTQIEVPCTNVRRRYVLPTHSPTLTFSITPMPFHLSRCGIAWINILGLGPIRRSLSFKRIVESCFNVWEAVYLSLDGKSLHIYEHHSYPTPLFSIKLTNVEKLTMERSTRPSQSTTTSTSTPPQDQFMIVMRTFENDSILLSFRKTKTLHTWMRVLLKALHTPLPSLDPSSAQGDSFSSLHS